MDVVPLCHLFPYMEKIIYAHILFGSSAEKRWYILKRKKSKISYKDFFYEFKILNTLLVWEVLFIVTMCHFSHYGFFIVYINSKLTFGRLPWRLQFLEILTMVTKTAFLILFLLLLHATSKYIIISIFTSSNSEKICIWREFCLITVAQFTDFFKIILKHWLF